MFEIADRASLNVNTTRSTLYTMTRGTGPISVIGTRSLGFGRPANIYAFAA